MMKVAQVNGVRLQEKDQMNGCRVEANTISPSTPKEFKVKDNDYIFRATPGDSDAYVRVRESNDSYSGEITIGGGLLKSGEDICVSVGRRGYYNSMEKGKPNNSYWYTRFVYYGTWEYAPKEYDYVTVIAWWVDKACTPDHVLVATMKHGWITIAQ